MKHGVKRYRWLLFWYIAVCLSGFYEVQLHFNKRNLFQEYQSIFIETQKLEMEWKELQLDYSKITSGRELGFMAREKAKMKLPNSKKIKILNINEVN